MKRIVECVPNFSEGRDMKVIDAIAKSIADVQGAKLLSVEPDKDYNRCVVTFVGEPEPVKEAAFQATKTASELIDMSRHKGEHPRIGATDVVPFVPVSGVTMEECVHLAHSYGKRVGEELGIPVFLYEEAAQVPDRRNLSNIRKGEYEGLEEKLKNPAWKPDYGPGQFNTKSGAMVAGARVFLVAYNVNLNTNQKELAHEIALRIRESGRSVKNEKGESLKVPGALKSVKAMGVLLEQFNIAQVSINLTNFNITPPHVAFEQVKKEACTLGIDATGSEIVGLIPKGALLMAGRFYFGKDTQHVSEEQLIQRAIAELGLSQLAPFEPNKKVIEYMI
jgi:glutamate formiminotransferase/formiminotetrahydrofolate cyclodeaminase